VRGSDGNAAGQVYGVLYGKDIYAHTTTINGRFQFDTLQAGDAWLDVMCPMPRVTLAAPVG
jgi:hypothetical protein